MTHPFTKRETDIFNLICCGYTNAAISEALGMREQVVKNHLTIVYRKAGVKGRVQLATWRPGTLGEKIAREEEKLHRLQEEIVVARSELQQIRLQKVIEVSRISRGQTAAQRRQGRTP